MSGATVGVRIRGCVFQFNKASTSGSAVRVVNLNNVVFEDCRFENNSERFETSYLRGTIETVGAHVAFVRCEFRNNSAGRGAGIAAITESALVVIDCLFDENVTDHEDATALGGAIFLSDTVLARISGSTFTRNRSDEGGAIHMDGGSTLIDRCIMRGNTSTNLGGAVFVESAEVVVSNCEMVGNVAMNDGGAAAVRNGGSAHFESCTITANHAVDAIGGIFPMGLGNLASLMNTICIGNTSGAAGNTNFGGTGAASAYSTSYSIVPTADLPAGAHISQGNFVADPMFVGAPSPGQDGVWGTMDDDYGDLRLSLGASPAIDAGDSTRYRGPLHDLGGLARLVDDPSVSNTGNHAGMAPIDIGAHEAQGPPCAADFNGDGSVNGADLASLLANWGICP